MNTTQNFFLPIKLNEKLLGEKSPKKKLAFVGDGINDAPVLSRADIGIAMGALGSDAAIEAADIVLMDDDPSKIALARKISVHTLKIVKENIWFAHIVKAVCLVLGCNGSCGIKCNPCIESKISWIKVYYQRKA